MRQGARADPVTCAACALRKWARRPAHAVCMLVKFVLAFRWFICRSTNILRFIIKAVMGTPRLTMAVVLVVLVALAATMTYTGFLVVGVVAELLGTSRFVGGLLLGVVFARFPWVRQGQPRIVGLLPKPLRRPCMLGLLTLCLMRFSVLGETAPALLVGLTMAIVLGFPWLKKALFMRVSSSVMDFAGSRSTHPAIDDSVIEGEFRERKD